LDWVAFKKFQKNEKCYPFHTSSYFKADLAEIFFWEKFIIVQSLNRIASAADYCLFVSEKAYFPPNIFLL